MIIKPLHPTNTSQSLLLFFAGWGMDETPFTAYRPQGSDFMICYDYRCLDFNTGFLTAYKEIHLVAWSMGVWVASQIMQSHELPITQSIAINGTPYPVDEERGIAPAIFEGTLNGLNEASLRKFQRRMCGSATTYKEFAEKAPLRSVEELREELAAIGQQYEATPAAAGHWDKAIIGQNDHIFPTENQLRAWQGTDTEIECIEAAHYQVQLFNETLK